MKISEKDEEFKTKNSEDIQIKTVEQLRNNFQRESESRNKGYNTNFLQINESYEGKFLKKTSY